MVRRAVHAAMALALAGMVIFGGAAVSDRAAAAAPPAREVQEVRVGYLSRAVALPPGLSSLEVPPEDAGLQGARLAIADNNTTGRFTGHHFTLAESVLPEEGDVAAAFHGLGAGFVVSTLDGAGLDKLLAACSASTCRTAPGIRARSPGPRASCRWRGTGAWSSGARGSCSRASSARPGGR